MTEKQQRRFYFPAWQDACRANGWRMERGCLLLDESRLNDHGRKVFAAAHQIASQAHRAIKVDDLRHGAHAVVLGRDKSSSKFSNAEVDKVVSFFRLLQDETDISADMRLSNPAIGEREALVHKINTLKIPLAVIAGVCRKAFAPVYEHPFYEDLPLVNLRALVAILLEIQQREQQKSEDPY